MSASSDDRPAPAASGPATQERRRRRGPFSRRLIQGPRTVEDYLRAQSPPRYMQRLRDIEGEFRLQVRRLEAAYRALEEACGDDARAFARGWRAQARAWRFANLNDLVRQHNDWYPIEAKLAMNPRTRDYVPVHGRSYRRLELGAEWVLHHFPPERGSARDRPPLPTRAPREPLPERRRA